MWPHDRRVVEQMLVGVATRRYAQSLEPVLAPIRSRGTSRRFGANTTAQLVVTRSPIELAVNFADDAGEIHGG
jgi:hypothetical protein